MSAALAYLQAFLALPLPLKLLRVFGVLLVAALIWGAYGSWLGMRWRARDLEMQAKVTELQIEVEQKLVEVTKIAGALEVNSTELATARRKLAESEKERARLIAVAEESNAKLRAARQSLLKVRRGDDPRPIAPDELDERIRSLYPEPGVEPGARP